MGVQIKIPYPPKKNYVGYIPIIYVKNILNSEYYLVLFVHNLFVYETEEDGGHRKRKSKPTYLQFLLLSIIKVLILIIF